MSRNYIVKDYGTPLYIQKKGKMGNGPDLKIGPGSELDKNNQRDLATYNVEKIEKIEDIELSDNEIEKFLENISNMKIRRLLRKKEASIKKNIEKLGAYLQIEEINNAEYKSKYEIYDHQLNIIKKELENKLINPEFEKIEEDYNNLMKTFEQLFKLEEIYNDGKVSETTYISIKDEIMEKQKAIKNNNIIIPFFKKCIKINEILAKRIAELEKQIELLETKIKLGIYSTKEDEIKTSEMKAFLSNLKKGRNELFEIITNIKPII